MTSLRNKVEQRLTAMYLSGLPVKNLDTGEIESPKELEEALWYHLPAVLSLLEQTVLDVIGEDEKGAIIGHIDLTTDKKKYQNTLRSEQRTKLSDLLSTEETEL